MFSATLESAIILKKIVEAIKDIVNNVSLEATPKGLSMQAMDPTHVALVGMRLDEGGFKEYRADKNHSLGIKLGNLNKLLKCAGNDDTVTLSCEDEPTQLSLNFSNPTQEATFNLNLMNFTGEQLHIPETEYKSIITMSSADFSKICKDLVQISENVTIETRRNSIIFQVDGDIASGGIEKKENNSDRRGEQVLIDVVEPVKNLFSLAFLNSFNKAAALSDQVTLKLSENIPLAVEYKIDNIGVLQFYLAPKLSDD